MAKGRLPCTGGDAGRSVATPVLPIGTPYLSERWVAPNIDSIESKALSAAYCNLIPGPPAGPSTAQCSPRSIGPWHPLDRSPGVASIKTDGQQRLRLEIIMGNAISSWINYGNKNGELISPSIFNC